MTTMREIDEAVKTIPELDEILDQAVKSLKLDKAPPATIIKNFNQLVVDLESTAFKFYKNMKPKLLKSLPSYGSTIIRIGFQKS